MPLKDVMFFAMLASEENKEYKIELKRMKNKGK